MPFFKFTTPDTLTRILQGVEEILRHLGRLPPLPTGPPPPPAVPTITKSIGTSSRDYSTITSWEADLDNGAVYASGDTAVGECYDDSAFDESFTMDGGTTIGLVTSKLSVASGHRHDGTAGTGARIVRTTGATIITANLSTLEQVVEWLEINGNGNNGLLGISRAVGNNTGSNMTIARMLVHNATGTATNQGMNVNRAYVLNNIVYNITSTGTAASIVRGINLASTRVTEAYNNTVHKITRTNGTGVGIGISFADNANGKLRNNLSTDVTGTSSGTIACFDPSSAASATLSNNAASDTSASGTGSLDSITTANQYVSTVGGSEDLHLKSGADAINAGTDLVTTPSGVQYDIDNRDRDAQGDTWDIGADEFVAAAGVAVAVFYYHLQMQGIG